MEHTCNSQNTAASATPVTCNVSDPDPAHSSPTTPPALPPPRSSDRVHLVVCYSTQCRSHTVWDQMPIATTLPGSPTLSNQVSHATPTARRATHMPSPFDTHSPSWPSPSCSHMGLPAALATGAAGTCVAGRSPSSAPSALGLDGGIEPWTLNSHPVASAKPAGTYARRHGLVASRAPRRVVATAEDGLSAPRATLSPLGVAAAAPT